jgi:hypothetical protein
MWRREKALRFKNTVLWKEDLLFLTDKYSIHSLVACFIYYGIKVERVNNQKLRSLRFNISSCTTSNEMLDEAISGDVPVNQNTYQSFPVMMKMKPRSTPRPSSVIF